jgi:hypothetical protein
MGLVISVSGEVSTRGRAWTTQPISTSSVFTEPGPSGGTASATGCTSGCPAARGPTGRTAAWLTTSELRAVAVNGLA